MTQLFTIPETQTWFHTETLAITDNGNYCIINCTRGECVVQHLDYDMAKQLMINYYKQGAIKYGT